MKRALISDIHANLEALRAVLADIQEQKISQIYCLGDIIGYGPNPRECLDQVMKLPVVILGNHDQAALIDPEGFNPVALQAVYWTRDQLEHGPGTPSQKNKRWDFLGELHRTHSEGEYLFVHGSPREPTNEYVFPEDIYNQRKMSALFGMIDRLCFQGHTHLPGVFTDDYQFYGPEDVDYSFRLDARKTMCNVGSVGQPRDADWRACYALFDGETIYYRRVEYDVQTTVRKIQEVDELDNFLADRLWDGR